MASRKRIFVSGASGFIGRAVVSKLAKQPLYDVTGLLLKEDEVLPENISPLFGDLYKPKTFDKTVIGCDVFVHLASQIDINSSLAEPKKRMQDGLSMILNVLEVFRESGQKPLIIFTSTDRVYGATHEHVVTEASRPTPIEPYTASKILCEIALETYQRLYGIPYITLRLSSVYGPHQPRTMFISDVIQKMKETDMVTVGNLETKKNFVYVEDVAESILKAIEAPGVAHNQIYNIGGQSVTMTNVIDVIKNTIETRTGRRLEIESKNDSRPSSIEVHPFELDVEKANKQLGWRPSTSLDEGLGRTVDYFLS